MSDTPQLDRYMLKKKMYDKPKKGPTRATAMVAQNIKKGC